MTGPTPDPGRPRTQPTPATAHEHSGHPKRLEHANAQLARRNEQLVEALNSARDALATLRERVAALDSPPQTHAVVTFARDVWADLVSNGRPIRARLAPGLEDRLHPGDEVLLNEELTVVARIDPDESPARHGDVMIVHELWDTDRLVVTARGEDRRVVRRAHQLQGVPLKPGDPVLIDSRAALALEPVPVLEVEDLTLEEVPDVSYDDIGGLSEEIDQIRDAIELPYLHPELYRDHQLRPPKGVLLYGPPGTGKTLIAKAVAASLARQSAQRDTTATGASGTPRSYFLNVKGPELLNKFVGETERQIRVVFTKAKEHASDGIPVVVFFDEMEALFRARGSGISSDVETTIVPQLLAEIDGVEQLNNVIIIGASNREDMLDPAVMRPGRLDTKIRIGRPDATAAREIFSKYVVPSLPLGAEVLAEADGNRQVAVAHLIDTVVDFLYERSEEHHLCSLLFASGRKEEVYFADIVSGAMIANIVDRAKRLAIKQVLAGGDKGLTGEHLRQACAAEFRESGNVPGVASADEWWRVLDTRGERVVDVIPPVR
ncbi:proteasome ATPase [Dermatophilus congolensis]|uniref:proteasome ATPase n=1 Tax=Dermatophilus congolensis TaxID=1863 RepID=UPI001AAE8C1C|nr:proteasome ATPase [Dermatophilus congolensis]MBO3142839.1 proteasome ATPase [Dermatophilus congolensis]MBO3151833.1 proteasome ATPase [Dermatophilus congolensis]MBO3161164.1 proteasome ATPase [Dermatophilus congolensis]MBO3163115.1 proteasome ATPase [Dermatophilus congolensis]MBO3176669.1 proteasome ATPase [Dermatophilus congolensis]